MAKQKKRQRMAVSRAIVFIKSTFNNTIITIADRDGNTICWSSGGTVGYKGSRKSTPYAAQLAAQQAARTAQDNGMREVDVFIKGPGPGREAIEDVTPLPHNGCRAKKRRRV